MTAMEQLVASQKVRLIGLSNFNLAQLREAQAALKSEKISSVQLSYSLLDRRIEQDILPYCVEHGIAVLAYYPLAHGKLTEKTRELSVFVEKYRKTPAQIALNWLASKENVFPIPRASTSKHVHENVGAVTWTMTEADTNRLEEVFPISKT
jgi:diketogulonate reductase-like aldo/keto reductase